jgi:hypothetical protein
MGRTKTDNTEQLVIRIPLELRGRLDVLVAKLGLPFTLTDVARRALKLGVEELETVDWSSGPWVKRPSLKRRSPTSLRGRRT